MNRIDHFCYIDLVQSHSLVIQHEFFRAFLKSYSFVYRDQNIGRGRNSGINRYWLFTGLIQRVPLLVLLKKYCPFYLKGVVHELTDSNSNEHKSGMKKMLSLCAL